MVSKTREKIRQTNKHKHKHKRRAQTKKNETLTPDTPGAPAQVIESHRFMTSMTFDGNTLTTKTQKDNEPVIERRYTKEQLAREIPIGKEMVDMYLDGKMPKGLQDHHRNHTQGTGNRSPVFQNVLASPADLGLLPPRSTYDKEVDDFLRQGRRQTKKIRMKRQEKRSRNNNDIDREHDTGLEMIINENNKKKHLFDLP
jgi:hypothetical protein